MYSIFGLKNLSAMYIDLLQILEALYIGIFKPKICLGDTQIDRETRTLRKNIG